MARPKQVAGKSLTPRKFGHAVKTPKPAKGGVLKSVKDGGKAPRSKDALPKAEAKPRRHRAGGVATRSLVKKLQRSSKLMAQRQPFEDLVRHCAEKHTSGEGIRFKRSAVRAMQHGVEGFLTKLISSGFHILKDKKKKTLTGSEMQTAVLAREDNLWLDAPSLDY